MSDRCHTSLDGQYTYIHGINTEEGSQVVINSNIILQILQPIQLFRVGCLVTDLFF